LSIVTFFAEAAARGVRRAPAGKGIDMTAHKHLKEIVRARMRKTGESYATARRHVVGQIKVPQDSSPSRWHLPGNIPATTALRVLVTAAGIRDPRDRNPMSEALLFGICGGIGMGVASFYYEKADFSSFYIAGRHLWTDDAAYLGAALTRLEVKPDISETAGEKGAAKNLLEALKDGRPCIAWLDMAGLPHRGMPPAFSGSGYHLVTVYSLNEDGGTAVIGDLTDVPIEIDLKHLAQARARIKQFKNRLMSIPRTKTSIDLDSLVNSGLRACYEGLLHARGKGAGMSGLEVLQKWETQLGSDTGDGWASMFPRGHRLWQGLTSIHDCIENYHTGGGLCRPIFAEFLAEASTLPGRNRLAGLSQRYAELGRMWSDLALSAVPQEVPAFREVRELYVLRSELRTGGDPEDVAQIRDVWARLSELQKNAAKDFPLSESECTDLRHLLHAKVAALYKAEVEAHSQLKN
jgi:hypothetical protein